MGRKDLQKKGYLYDPARFADLINGVVCAGRQVLAAEDLTELDSQTGQFTIAAYDGNRSGREGVSEGENNGRSPNKIKSGNLKNRNRDLLRRAAFGVNFMVIGIENQEDPNYLMPLRCMSYDTAEYEKQAVQIGKKVRNRKRGEITKAEFLSGFTKDSRLSPCVTIVLYYGEDWDGATTLREILDLESVPPELQNLVNDYKIYVCEVRKFENTEVFKTDVKQVFDCLRYAKEPEKLYQLMANDPAYRAMESDTYEAIVEYTGASELMKVKEYGEDGKVDMSDIATELIELGRRKGIEQGIEQGMINAITELLEELGQVPQQVMELIRAQDDPAVLSRWIKAAAKAANIAEFERNMNMS